MLHGLVCELPPYQTLDAFFFLVCIVSVKKNSSFLSMLYSIVCQLPPYQTLDAFLFFCNVLVCVCVGGSFSVSLCASVSLSLCLSVSLSLCLSVSTAALPDA